MSDEKLRDLWKRHGKEPAMSRAELDRIVRQGLRSGMAGWKSHVLFNLVLLVATVAFAAVNAVLYRANPGMLAAELGVALAAAVLLAFGIHVYGELRRMSRGDEPLVTALGRRLAFVRSKYELWLWAAALTCLLLIVAVTTFLDERDGIYRIHQPLVFWGSLVAALVLVYGTGKLATWLPVREARDALEDLEEGTGERVAAAPRRRRIYFWFSVVAFLVLTATAFLGLLLALGR